MEYITGGGMRRENIPASLAGEGKLMLCALVEDLLALSPSPKLLVMVDDRFAWPFFSGRVETVMIGAEDAFPAVWKECIGLCDAVWPIAPETGGILEQICLDVEAAGTALLTCPSAAVRIAASKLKTARRLEEFGLPVVNTTPLDGFKFARGQTLVVKHDDGVGCENTFIVGDAAQWQSQVPSTQGNAVELAYLNLIPKAFWIVQPLVEGEPMSLSVLFAHGKALVLSCNRQIIDRGMQSFSLLGCVVNATHDLDGSLQQLAGKVASAMPELWGYAGIDLMLTENGPLILEINPRLTTSYAGLRDAIETNPAGLLMDLLNTGKLPTFPTAYTGRPVEIDLGKSCDD
jgi:predicted ATP-grasp superfamily ATP-dependent carboligase